MELIRQDCAPTITVITATKNVGATISRLYESLKQQTHKRFEWVVVDGLSIDSTVQQLQQFAQDSPWLRFISEMDQGLYDAINKGIGMATGSYYVVAGADDVFEPNALHEYWNCAQREKSDVVLAKVIRDGAVFGEFKPRRAWLGHSKAFTTSHSVGMLFRRSLHSEYGLYSNRFPLLADGYFLKVLLRGKRARFTVAKFIAGTFATHGLSSTRKLQTLVETWEIQMLTEKQKLIQVILFLFKVLAKYPLVRKEIETRHRGNPKIDVQN